jgi:hypothetical protein
VREGERLLCLRLDVSEASGAVAIASDLLGRFPCEDADLTRPRHLASFVARCAARERRTWFVHDDPEVWTPVLREAGLVARESAIGA